MYEEITILRDDIVRLGKADSRFVDLGKKKGRKDEKYRNPDNLEDSGSISAKDAMVIYEMVTKYKVEYAIEIGSWFGTSAAVMASAGATVDTCDKHDVFVAEDKDINKYTMMSTEFLRRMKNLKHRYDFAFVDARLKKEDKPILFKILRSPRRILLHDWHMGKGDANVTLLKNRYSNFKMTEIEDTCMVFLEEKT